MIRTGSAKSEKARLLAKPLEIEYPSPMRPIAALLTLWLLWGAAGPASSHADVPSEPLVRNVAVLLYGGVELLDFAGPAEVFSASRSEEGRRFRVYTVAETTEPVVSQGFARVVPEYSIVDCPRPDLIVVPGGAVPLSRPAVVEWVRRSAGEAEVAMSVCNGALLFAKAGLLDGAEATTHQSSLGTLALSAPNARLLPERRIVDNGRVVTTAGVSAGIDGALHVVARLLGDEAARRTALYMEYRWDPAGAEEYHRRVIAAGAPPRVFELVGVALSEGVECALSRWKEMAEPPSEEEVNGVAYFLLGAADRPVEALCVFELNAAAFPESANVWDSLADGCLALGRDAEALEHTRRCLAQLEADTGPDTEHLARLRQSALEKLARLEAATEDASRPVDRRVDRPDAEGGP